jgi:hypothetical protein
MPRRWYQRPPARHVTVDREARDAMAELIRAFAARRIPLDTFQDMGLEVAKGSHTDPSVSAAFDYCWLLYDDDFGFGRIPKIPREHRRVVARIIVFLRSDETYCWVPIPSERRALHWPAVLADAVLWLIAGLKVPIVGIIAFALRVRRYFTPDWIAPRRPVREERKQAWPFPDVASLRRAETEVTLLRGLPCV